MNEIFENLYEMTAFSNIIAEPQFLIMYAIAFVLLYLGIKKQYEPLLLVPIAFGVLLANFPGGDMGVIQADENGMVMVNGVLKNIWEMPLHDIAHELGLMNFIYYMLIKTGLPVVLWDERLTTIEANEILIESGVRREDRKKVIDKIAATLILQSYLGSLK